MKKFLLFLLISVFGFTLVACGGPGPDDEDDEKDFPETALAEGFTSLANPDPNGEIDDDGYYTVGTTKIKTVDVYKTTYTTEPTKSKFNYLTNTWTYNSEHYTNMVDGLIENNKKGALVGALAVGYKLVDNEDGTQTWTFQLKEGVKWIENETGEEYAEVVADDFVAGIEYVLNPINASGTAGIVTGLLKNSKDYYTKKSTPDTSDDIPFSQVGVKEVSKYQVAFTLIQPTPYFLSSLTYSPFLPVSRAYLEEMGTDFGATENNILVNGAFRIVSHVANSKMVYQKNPTYWDRKHVYVNKVEKRFVPGTTTPAQIREWFEAGEIDGFNVNPNDEVGYKKYVTGEDGSGTIKNPISSEANGVLSVGDATYIGYFNFVRSTYEYTNAADQKSEAQKAATAKAVLNVNFRKGFLYGLNVLESLKYWNEPEPYQRLMRSYTNRELAVDKYGKDYCDYVDDVFNEKQGTTGVTLTGINQEGDPVFNPTKAADFFSQAKTQLIAAGLTEADFPIQIDVIGNMQAVRRAREQKMYDALNTAGAGVVEIKVNVPSTNDENARWGSEVNNYDYSMWSGWGPDYADPKTFLNTMAIEGDMVDMLGFTQADATNIALEEEVLGDYDALFRIADAITDVSKLEERYQKMAEAEYALIYEYAIIIPWLAVSGYTPVVSRVVPFQVGKAPYGLTTDKLKNVIVSDTTITKTIRAAVKADYEG